MLKGHKKGREVGRKEGLLMEVALRMVAGGMAIEDAAELAGVERGD